MAKQKELQKEIIQKTDADLRTLITENREALRSERFKDKFSRKAGLIKEKKQQIARALTELKSRQKS